MTQDHSTGAAGKLFNLPLVTFGIVALNVVVLLVTSSHLKDAIYDYGLTPHSFRVGNLLTANAVHDGWVHLIYNMGLLVIFGGAVERVVGRLEYLLFYIGACIAASLSHVAVVLAALMPYYETLPVVGASGAVAGVMGIYAVRFHRKSFSFFGLELPALVVIMVWLVFQLGLGILGLYRDDLFGLKLKYVAYWSHLGGFGFGIIVALLTNMALHGEREYLIDSARENEDAGNLLEATQNYEMLLKYDPDNPLAHAEMGRLWATMDERDQSLPCYLAAIELFIRQGQESRASEVAAEMKRFWPDAEIGAATRFRLASYLEETGQFTRAVQMFQEIASSAPDSVEAQMSLLKIGQLMLISLRDPASAISTLEDFLDRYPLSEWRPFAEETLARTRALWRQSVSDASL